MKRGHILLAILAAGGCSNAAPENVPSAGGSDPLARAESTIMPEDMYRRIAFLASDEMRGRDTPSPGLERAAAWIAAELRSFGVRPAGDDGGWLQRYPYPLEGLNVDGSRLEILGGGQVRTLDYGTDYYAQGGRAPTDGVGAVYVGGAIGAAAGELRDRAAVVRIDGAPAETPRGLRFPRETRTAIYNALVSAEEAGAAALLFVLDAAVSADQVRRLAQASARPSRSLGGGSGDAPPAAFFVTRDAAGRLFAAARLDPGLLDATAPLDRPLPLGGITLRLAAPVHAIEDSRPPNVVGLLPGRDPALRDTYVVVSAHMDHVGIGPPVDGDSIYNGADDDASGTAALLEVAQALAALPAPPRRSVLFLAVSGEEKGLLGSRWFADHPTVPAERMVANLNLDMVGRNAPDSIVVIGQDYSSLGPLVNDIARANPGLGLTVSEDLWPEQRFFFRSDHFHFARKEIPALFFFAGTHEDYHGPDDEVDAIDTGKAARVARLVFLTAHAIAERTDAPEWTEQGLADVRRLTQ